MDENYAKLKSLLAVVADLNHTAALLGWDQQTYMPAGSAEERGNQLATISSLSHDKFTDPEVGRLIGVLKPWAASLDPDSADARMIRVTARDYDKATRVPSEFVAEFAQVTTVAVQAWQEAKGKSDFSIFRPHLEKIVELNRRYVTFFPPADHPYDVLLDTYEPGMKTADVKGIFGVLRPQQVELIKALAARPQVDDSFIHLDYPEKVQWDFGVEIATRFGYDWNRGRQDKSAHPFTTSFGIDDVRVTTRFEGGLNSLFSTMHETGHALYEQGVRHDLGRTPLEGGASLAVHESQSRLWENLVGRSMPFWEYFFPRLQAAFPQHLKGLSLENFYKGINRVAPTLIRVNADEATYNLHIMLRLELEIALVEGTVAVKELPEVWNAKMQEYLGIQPPNDAQGVLQDIHWSGGSLGYFSTYALGNLISVQLWEKYKTVNPDIEDQIRKGDFSSLLGWLRTEIHDSGRTFEPQELVQRVTGSRIDPAPYLRYLKKKYGEIYGL